VIVMAEGVEARLQELDRELRNGHFEVLRQFLADDYFGCSPGPDEPAASDRITDLVTDLEAALPDLTAALDAIRVDAEGNAAAELTVRGTHTKELWGVPGSGDAVEWTGPVSIRSIGDRFAVRFDDLPTPQRVGLVRQLRLVNPADQMDQPPQFPVVWPEFLLRLVFTGEAGDRTCSHLDQIAVTDPTVAVCEQCVESGDIWPALRMCLVCGFVGCCDTSKNRHMPQHHQETGHCIFRSIRDDEGWIWCYEDDAFFDKATLDRFR
jgi:Zn-finger in ubiquitin-hydrolases and other protein/SnoaL-like polyketide cyclase